MIQAALEKAPGAPKGWWGHLFPEPGSLETKQNHPRFPWHISMGRTLCSLLTDEMRFLLFSQNWLLMATAHLKPFDFFFFFASQKSGLPFPGILTVWGCRYKGREGGLHL